MRAVLTEEGVLIATMQADSMEMAAMLQLSSAYPDRKLVCLSVELRKEQER